MIGYPGNGEYPKPYAIVEITTISRGRDKSKRKGFAYWSGFRWMGLKGFTIGYAKVIKWEKLDD